VVPKGPPRPLNFPFCGRVSGAAVHDVDIELGTQYAQIMTCEAGVIIQKQAARGATAGDRIVKDSKEPVLGFTETGFEIRNDSAAIIEESEDDCQYCEPGGNLGRHRYLNRQARTGNSPDNSVCRRLPMQGGDR